ncbi:MAG: hypothetical protein HQ513_14480 [Rhodospirillales bacterium]|nr:hypothetical protein [Rhodospirillales bacterium]
MPRKTHTETFSRREALLVSAVTAIATAFVTSFGLLIGRNYVLVERFKAEVGGERKKTNKYLLRKASRSLTLAGLIVAGFAVPAPAFSGQQSTDARLLQVYREVDKRNLADDKRTKAVFKDLSKVYADIEGHEKSLDALPPSLSDDERGRLEQVIIAKIIHAKSKIYESLKKHLDARQRVVGENLESLHRVLTEFRKSGKSTGGIKELTIRISRNTQTGRSMRGALAELSAWAQNNPGMKTRSASLRRLMSVLDRKIGLDKSRLAIQRRSAVAGYDNRTVDTLSAAFDKLGDEATANQVEMISLQTFKDELTIGLELSRLQISERIAKRIYPAGPGGRSQHPSMLIRKFIEGMGDLNDRIIRSNNQEAPGGDVPGTSLDEFTNF